MIRGNLAYKNEMDLKIIEGKRIKKLYRKQKLYGVILFLVGLIAPIFCDGDASASIVLLPLGAWLLGTKNRILEF